MQKRNADSKSGATQVKRIPGIDKRAFYTKYVTYRGIAIKAPKVVADEAVREARRRLQMMLHAVPDISANLKSHGAELHIIGKNQLTSHLPEYRHWHGKPFDGDMNVDERTRGLGGIPASCAEENLLRLKQDRYLGRDICVHEFAHTIHLYGLDDKTRRKIQTRYKRSLTCLPVVAPSLTFQTSSVEKMHKPTFAIYRETPAFQ